MVYSDKNHEVEWGLFKTMVTKAMEIRDEMHRLIILYTMRLCMVMVVFFVVKNPDERAIGLIFSGLWFYTEYSSKSISYTLINKYIAKVTKE